MVGWSFCLQVISYYEGKRMIERRYKPEYLEKIHNGQPQNKVTYRECSEPRYEPKTFKFSLKC